MENIDFFPQSKVLFRYDLKFSEVNRLHIQNLEDVHLIQEYLTSIHPLSLELTLNGKTSIANFTKSFDEDVSRNIEQTGEDGNSS